MKISFSDTPLLVVPEANMLVVALAEQSLIDGEFRWQIRYYSGLDGKVKIHLGAKPHAVDEWEVIAHILQMEPSVLVMREDDFVGVFQPLFDTPTVRYQLPAVEGDDFASSDTGC